MKKNSVLKETSIVDIYLNEVNRRKILSPEDEFRLACQAKLPTQEGSLARTAFLEANLRLVVFHAQRVKRRSQLDLTDLIQEGNLGLMKALDGYRPDMGFRFSTYATWWIRQTMTRASKGLNLIHIPNNRLAKIDLITEASLHLYRELHRTPTAIEIAALLELPLDLIEDTLSLPQVVTTLSEPVGEEEGLSLADLLPDLEADDPEEITVEKELTSWVKDQLQNELPEREFSIFVKRYGLDGHEPVELIEIGAEHGLTKERVRQIIRHWTKKIAAKIIPGFEDTTVESSER